MTVYNYTLFNDPSATTGGTQAFGINDSGQIVGEYFSNIFRGFLLAGGTFTALNDPAAGTSSGQGTLAQGINNTGQVVGYYVDATNNTHGFIDSGGVYTSLDVPFAPGGTFAQGINSSGLVVGYYVDVNVHRHGFVYNPNSGAPYTTLNDPDATGVSGNGDTFAEGINGSGLIVGYYTTIFGFHGFLYNPSGGGSYTTIDYPTTSFATRTFLYGINDAGQIVGQYNDSTGIHSFIYSNGTFTNIDDTAPNTQTFACGINNNGQVSGYVTDGTGNHAFFMVPSPNPPPPSGTTADMILRGANNSSAVVAGHYEIYDIGSNSILAGYSLGAVGTDWQFVGLGGFNGSDTTDMVLRNSSTGAFEVYDVSNNNITNASSLGSVGLNWQFGGFGDFSSNPGETDMILRNTGNGALEVYDIANNSLTNAFSMGAVGLNWQIAGFGDFSSRPNETDMIMRNTSTGALEVYDIANDALTSAFSMGAVGLDWQVAGFGNFRQQPRRNRHDHGQCQYRRIRSLRHRQQCPDQCFLHGRGRAGLACCRLRADEWRRHLRHGAAQRQQRRIRGL
jgi:probable HAF family extracellular repeat protein